MQFFRKIPLPGKLFLLVLLPMVLIVLLTLRVYQDNNERVRLLKGYVDHIELFADLSAAASHLQLENRRAYIYAIKKDSSLYGQAVAARSSTDSVLRLLDENSSATISGYRSYTFLDSLEVMRQRIDSSSTLNPDRIMHYYTTAIFRIKTVAQSAAVNNHLVDTIFEELTSARILNDMFMYMGIVRTNFYKALYQRHNNILMLYGLQGSYDVLGSYEKELLTKAGSLDADSYRQWRQQDHVKRTFAYLDTVFGRFAFDMSMDADEWWEISGRTNDEINARQQALVDEARKQMKSRLQKEIRKRDTGLLIMMLALVGVLVYMFYTSRVINSQLNVLDDAAQKIAVGEEAAMEGEKPNDVIGRLTASIQKIDSNNKQLAMAATQIGKGNFDIDIQPRGEKDMLGIAIGEMKDDLQEYIAEIKEHERRKDDFIVMASHELKTPITSIKGYVQLLTSLFHEYQKTKELPSEESVSSSLGTIEKQINKLTRLLSELLDLSRLERGKMELDKKRFDLSELIRETIDEVRHSNISRDIRFTDGVSAEVFADRDRIGQVMLNLLTNALKYSKAPDPVIVNLTAGEKNVKVSVSDAGIGISEAEQSKIFERFYRVQGKNEQTYPGFGIGLYIANEIISRHGGSLHVQSQVGQGSVFEFVLERI